MLRSLEQAVINPANRRYALAEVAAITSSYVAAFTASWHLQDQGTSEGLEATLTYAAKTVVYYGANLSVYAGLFFVQEVVGSCVDDLTRLVKSNLKTTAVHGIATILAHYFLEKSGFIEKNDVAPLVYPLIGVVCFGLKQWWSYGAGLFGRRNETMLSRD